MIGLDFIPQLKKKNSDYITYNYVSKPGENNGSVTFVAKAYGTFHFRFIRNNIVFAACKVDVGPVVELKGEVKEKEDKTRSILIQTNTTFGAIPSKSWIGLFHKAEPNLKNWIQYEYASKSEITFSNQLKPAIYNCRLVSGYDVLATSNDIVISGEDQIFVDVKQEIEITYQLQTILSPYWEGAWFGVFTSSETDENLWKLYSKIVDPKGIIKIKLPKKSGSYDIRLFAGSKLIKRTAPFEVNLEK